MAFLSRQMDNNTITLLFHIADWRLSSSAGNDPVGLPRPLCSARQLGQLQDGVAAELGSREAI